MRDGGRQAFGAAGAVPPQRPSEAPGARHGGPAPRRQACPGNPVESPAVGRLDARAGVHGLAPARPRQGPQCAGVRTRKRCGGADPLHLLAAAGALPGGAQAGRREGVAAAAIPADAGHAVGAGAPGAAGHHLGGQPRRPARRVLPPGAPQRGRFLGRRRPGGRLRDRPHRLRNGPVGAGHGGGHRVHRQRPRQLVRRRMAPRRGGPERQDARLRALARDRDLPKAPLPLREGKTARHARRLRAAADG